MPETEEINTPACHYCGVTAAKWGEVSPPEFWKRELRPYGPGGSWVCHPCATATPERHLAMQQAVLSVMEANTAISPTGIIAIGEESGPRPFDPREKGRPQT